MEQTPPAQAGAREEVGKSGVGLVPAALKNSILSTEVNDKYIKKVLKQNPIPKLGLHSFKLLRSYGFS